VATGLQAAQMPSGDEYTNSVGMKFVRIGPGEFQMGQLKRLIPEVLPEIEGGDRGGRFDLQADGDYDERPIHSVRITKPFYVGVLEVTNKQYELYDPAHKAMRGRDGISTDDDEAVVYVSWYDAQGFCRWLSDRDGLPYRLPTEAEWEYACRAATATNYYTGDVLPEQFTKRRSKEGTPLFVGKTPPNPWGLFDMHGNVEEWCHDWYGPYTEQAQTDPVGYAQGDFRVTRGGSFGTYAYFLRSANRLGTLPGDRNWVIGFRVVMGGLPDTKPLEAPAAQPYQKNVAKRDMAVVKRGPDPDRPYFEGPRKFVKIDRGAIGPVFAGHNHNPAIVECPNGDLFACWYTCVSEKDRELAVAATRLRYGKKQWEDAAPFWDAPDRNDHAPVLWYDDKTAKIYHFQPYTVTSTYSTLAVAMRTSADSGATWTRPRIIVPDHNVPGGHQLSEPAYRMNDGALAITTDGLPTLWISRNEGLTWESCGGDINGNHPGVAQLADGRQIGFLRDREVPAEATETVCEDMGVFYVHKTRPRRMARCYSSDLGKTWTHVTSPFPGVGGGQRLVLMVLREGPLFLASFADRGIIITDSSGAKREVRGMFAALSEDGGETWPYIRLVSDDGPGTPAMTTNGGYFAMSQRNAEYRGYMSGCQSLDGVIHLVSSYSHYSFNLAWLKTPPPPLKYRPIAVKHEVETFDGPDKFDLADWEPYHGHGGGFNGKGQYTMISRSHFQGMNRLIGAGSFEINMAFENIAFNPRGRTASPGITIWIKDAMMRRLHFYVRDDRLSLGLQDEEDPAKFPEGRDYNVKCSAPPTSAKLKFVYNEDARQVRIFYGLNGADATTELPHSTAGIYFGRPLTESTAVYIMMSNGQVDLDHFDIKPIGP
jgi:formylglycine-generating enzyme required for sulfatase activity